MEGTALASFKRLKGQERLNALLEFAYSERRAELSADDYRKLAFPRPGLEECLVDAASTNEPFVWPDEASAEVRACWRCEVAGKLFRAEDYPPDAAVEILDDTLTPARRAAILAGAPLTRDEWLALEEIEEGGFDDVFLFRCEDRATRGLTFIRRVRDWGEAVDAEGPFFDGEDPLATLVGEKDMLLRDGKVRTACTPEWSAR